MEDAVSRSSVESSSTNDDYVVVNGEPKLKITGTCSQTCICEMTNKSSFIHAYLLIDP